MHLKHFILVPEWKNYFHHVYFEFVPNFTPERIQSQRGRGVGVERDGGGTRGRDEYVREREGREGWRGEEIS